MSVKEESPLLADKARAAASSVLKLTVTSSLFDPLNTTGTSPKAEKCCRVARYLVTALHKGLPFKVRPESLRVDERQGVEARGGVTLQVHLFADSRVLGFESQNSSISKLFICKHCINNLAIRNCKQTLLRMNKVPHVY